MDNTSTDNEYEDHEQRLRVMLAKEIHHLAIFEEKTISRYMDIGRVKSHRFLFGLLATVNTAYYAFGEPANIWTTAMCAGVAVISHFLLDKYKKDVALYGAFKATSAKNCTLLSQKIAEYDRKNTSTTTTATTTTEAVPDGGTPKC